MWRDHLVAGDPHPDNCLLCPDGRLALLDHGLQRDLDADYLDGERDLMRAVAERDAHRVYDGLSRLGYLPRREPIDPEALLELITNAGQWLLSPGVRRLDPDYVTRILEQGYPPSAPSFALMRRLSIPPPTLLLRRMELQLLVLLSEIGAAADWGAISAEHHSNTPPSTALGRQDHAFFVRR